MFDRKISLCLCLAVGVTGCSRLDHIGKPPSFTPTRNSTEHTAMMNPGLPLTVEPRRQIDGASLWSGGRRSLLGDRRALKRGDILTVVIEIDEEAAISNSTSRSRSRFRNIERAATFYGIPQRIDRKAARRCQLWKTPSTLDSAPGSSGGDGSVKPARKS